MAAEADTALERSLLSSGIGAASSQSATVPTVDLAAGAAAAAAMWEAASSVGFFQVINHGISQAEIDGAFAAAAAFFSRPVAEKEAEAPFEAAANSGYEFMRQVRPSTGTPDQKESLQITARQRAMDGRWPQQPEGFETSARRFLDLAHGLGCKVLDLLEPKACPHLPPGTLSGSHTLWGAEGQSTLRLLHYPPLEASALLPGHWRAGPHTDWDCVTLLFQRPGEAGLECAPNPKMVESTSWLEVPPQEGAIAVNIGDMLARWSDGRVFSNLHRVRMPTLAECRSPQSRYSIAVFLQADRSVVLESEKQEPVTAGDYILGRIRGNYSACEGQP